MNPTPDGRTTLAHALAALRDDLAAQPPPPASVLAAAQQAARRAAGRTVPEARPAAAPAAAAAGQRTWRLPGWLPGGNARAQGGAGEIHLSGAPRGMAGLAGAWGPWAGAATCVVVLGISLLLALRTPQMPPVAQTGADRSAAWSPAGVRPASGWSAGTDAGASAGGALMPAMHFVPLVSPERLRALTHPPGSSGPLATADMPAWVVTTELPQQRLAAMGLPYDPGHAAEPLRAELLVAGSGEVLAVRLLF